MTTVDRDVAAESASARIPLTAVLLTVAAAFALWCVMFYLRAGDFWWSMTGAAGALGAPSLGCAAAGAVPGAGFAGCGAGAALATAD